MEQPGGISFTGSDPISQVATGIALVAILYLVLSSCEYFYSSYESLWQDRIELFPDTYPSGKMFTSVQNPLVRDVYGKKRTVTNPSNNQRSGIEFSYAMFLMINNATFSSGSASLYHILHKGYFQPYPLLGPGIFCWGNTNALRIYMNSYDTWDNYVDIDNIPIDKYFHLVVSCNGNTLYVYINGSLKVKQVLSGNTPPYQNFGDIYLFNDKKLTLNNSVTASLGASDPELQTSVSGTNSNSSLTFGGMVNGMVSRVYYFAYVLTYSEIQVLMNMGPSSTIVGADLVSGQYLADTWWVDNQDTTSYSVSNRNR